MVIQYYGLSCFKITAKPLGRATEDITIFLDPFDKSVGLRPPQGSADIVLCSTDMPAHNNKTALKGGPIVFDMPGEYAAKGVQIIGIDTVADAKEGAARGRTTIFVIETEELRLCHLGVLGTAVTEKQLEIIGDVDVLFLPVGDTEGLSPQQAEDIARAIEPAIIVPMHYKVSGATASLVDEKAFCANIGNCPKEKANRLLLKKKDLGEKNMEVVLLDIV